MFQLVLDSLKDCADPGVTDVASLSGSPDVDKGQAAQSTSMHLDEQPTSGIV